MIVGTLDRLFRSASNEVLHMLIQLSAKIFFVVNYVSIVSIVCVYL